MNYTVIYSAPVQTRAEKVVYESEEFKVVDKAKFIPVNSILSSIIEDGSNVRIIILESQREGVETNEIVEKCRKETEESLSGKGCTLEFEVVSQPFSASRKNMGKIYCELITKPIEGSTVIADVTYGPKYAPILIFCLLSYAERFLDCEIKNIVYGQVFFDKDHNPYEPKLFDVAAIYLLNSFSRFFGESRDDYDSFLKGFFK